MVGVSCWDRDQMRYVNKKTAATAAAMEPITGPRVNKAGRTVDLGTEAASRSTNGRFFSASRWRRSSSSR
jgi:hypothetical protein